MTDQAWRIQACRAPLKMLAACLLLSGCAAQQGAESMTHVVPGDGSTHRCYLACSSGFHTTVWQNWQEGPMATRIGGVEMGTPPVQPGSDRAAQGSRLPARRFPSRSRYPNRSRPSPSRRGARYRARQRCSRQRGAMPCRSRQATAVFCKSPNLTSNRLRPTSSPLRFNKCRLRLLLRNRPRSRRFLRRPPAVPRNRSSLLPKERAPVSASLATSPPKTAQICQGYPKRSRRRFSAAAR